MVAKEACSRLGDATRGMIVNLLEDDFLLGSRVGIDLAETSVDPLLLYDVNLMVGQTLAQKGVGLGQFSDRSEKSVNPLVRMALVDTRPILGQGSGPISNSLVYTSFGPNLGSSGGPIEGNLAQGAGIISSDLSIENPSCTSKPPSFDPPLGFIWKCLSGIWALVPQNSDSGPVKDIDGSSSKGLQDAELHLEEIASPECLSDSDGSISAFERNLRILLPYLHVGNEATEVDHPIGSRRSERPK